MSNSFQQAIAQREMELAAAQVSGNQARAAAILCKLGELYESCDYGQHAVDCYQQAVAVAQEIGDRDLEEEYLLKLGATFEWMGQLQPAIHCLEQIKTMVTDPSKLLYCLLTLERLHERQGDYEKALHYLELVRRIYENKHPQMGTHLQTRIIELRRKLDADDAGLNGR